MIRSKFCSWSLFLIALAIVSLNSCTKDETVSNAPVIYIKTPINGFEVDINDTLLLKPQVAYDDNSVYEWWLNGQPIPNSDFRVMKVIPNMQYGQFNYLIKVSNSVGFDTLSISVKSLVKVDFEEFVLDANLYSLGVAGSSFRSSKLLNFPVVNDTTNKYWSGFALSTKFTTSDGKTENQYSAFSSTGGDEKSKKFMVFREDTLIGEQFISFNDGKSHTIGLMAITNNSYTYWTMKVGNLSPKAKVFSSPNDFFKVRIFGYGDNGEITKVGDFYLAYFQSTYRNENYMVSDWTNIDLSSFGKVSKIGFKFFSSDTSENGIITPGYLCLDNIRILD